MQVKELMQLDGKTAVVTGGMGYLGSQVCSALLELGAKVIAVNRGKSVTFTDEFDGNEKFISLKHDLSTKDGVQNCVKEIRTNADNIEILVNNSYSWPQVVQFLDQEWEDFAQTIDTGIIAQLYLTKVIYQMMIDQAKGGSIINVASMYGKVSPDFSMYRDSGMGNAIEYGVTKAGMVQMTKYLASMGGQHKIRCNSISPGAFPRPGALDGKDWFLEELNKKIMLNRVGGQDELKGVIVLLATNLGSYITGEDIAVDGGWTAW